MFSWIRINLFDITGIMALGALLFFLSTSPFVGEGLSIVLPSSFQQLNTIFLSILIEAIPFVLIGVLIAGFIQIYVTEEHIKRWIPKNKVMAIVMGCVVGSLFPACECGIVPIVRRLVEKGVPLPAGIGFMLTGPLINPIVILSTYMAFGNDSKIASLRMGIGFIAALIISLIVGFLYKSNQLKHSVVHFHEHRIEKQSFFVKLDHMLKHSIDEFFDMAKFLIMGAFIAAFVQTYVSTKSLLLLGEGEIGSTLVMMGLAFFLSLCSEADAFIGSSFRNVFPMSSILAFLIYGPMIDLKNTIMLLSVFKAKFVFILLSVITIVVFICINLVNGL
ncbi:permease [Schinkia azotoformans]|uniref:permease n=1 Tax=Schinkia azotoformans TaxID=1454 RepID=UPI002E241D0A|nr:permease [Schinkia azotoformans]